jgi:SAM-dependent methyltransferase
MYDQVMDDLRYSYDRMAEERDQKEIASWKIEERNRFLSLLQREGKKKLLEIGAGTGIHGKVFHDTGLDVVCTDLSPEMVRLCQEKGLTAYVMDFLSLDFRACSFDAIYALNCLLHVPKQDLPNVLKVIQDLLRPGGLFYLGQYGGLEREGTWREDHYEPKRFFSFLSDDQIKETTTEFFQLLCFRQIPLQGEVGFHFQSLMLRRN